MKIDRVNYAKLIIACLSYFKLDETISVLSGGSGLCGEKVNHIAYICDVAREFSIYAGNDDNSDELFLKFKAVLDSESTLAKKLDILLDIRNESNGIYKDQNELEILQMKYLEMVHKQLITK